LTGLTDPRVFYWEPAKWIARLRRLRTDRNLIAFRTNLDAGHAGAAGRFQRLKEMALCDQDSGLNATRPACHCAGD
jgi:oligopeptidase B